MEEPAFQVNGRDRLKDIAANGTHVSVRSLIIDGLRGVWGQRWVMLEFALLFRIMEGLLLAPLAAQLDQAISGTPVVDSTELINFFLSPRGFSAAFLGVAITIILRVFEHAGLSHIAWQQMQGNPVRALDAHRHVIRRLPQLSLIVVLGILAVLVLSLPVLLVAAWFAWELLPKHDINYYLETLPAEFLGAIVFLVLTLLPMLGVVVWLAVRMRLMIQVQVCERCSAWESIRRSGKLVAGAWWLVARVWLWSFLVGLLFVFCSWGSGEVLSHLAGKWVADGIAVDWVVIVLLLALRVLLSSMFTLLGVFLIAVVCTLLYHRRRIMVSPLQSKEANEAEALDVMTENAEERLRSRSQRTWIGAGLIGTLIVASIISGLGNISELLDERPAAVTAHRGYCVTSAENTIESMEEAIEAGVQWAEIDVQMSKDKELIVAHDSDFSRTAGVPKKVWELDAAEIAMIELRGPASANGKVFHPPTFSALLKKVRGKIKLNVELKYYGDHQPNLAALVVDAIRKEEMVSDCVIQSLNYEPLQEVRRLEPRLRIGYLFSVNAQHPSRLEVDFFSVQSNRINPSFVEMAHQRGLEVHAWTVDSESLAQRLLDLGVDNLITNKAESMKRVVTEYAEMSPQEKLMRRMQTWLVE